MTLERALCLNQQKLIVAMAVSLGFVVWYAAEILVVKGCK